ncbi:MAG: phosphatase PAP2 family protein [Microgenomates group bacterium]|jgi:undecaprenyl-diphosphatase|nr:phosphatase PAP2 family protein [Microgenomates group bacterium]
MRSVIISLDQSITIFFNRLLPHNFFFDGFFSFFSIRGINTIFWIILALFWIYLAEKKSPGLKKKDIKFILIFSSSLLITAFFVNIILKNLIARTRPSLNRFQTAPASTSLICPVDFSFPSGHAAIAFAAASVLSAFDKKRKYLYYFIAFLIAFSRIYLGCHYFLDVFGGGLLGYLIAKWLLIKQRAGNN